MTQTSKRLHYYDSLRGIAIIGVVLIHALTYQGFTGTGINWTVFFRQIINFSVPLFLAISGFFVGGKVIHGKKEYISFIKNQSLRVLIPYVVWSFFYLIYSVFLLKSMTLSEFLIDFLIFQSNPVFYFIALILQCYLVLPIVMFNVKRSLIVCCIMSFVSCIVIYITTIYYNVEIPLLLYAGNFFTWGMFFVLGIYCRNNIVQLKNSYLFFLLIVLVIFQLLETNLLFNISGVLGFSISAVKISSFLYSTCVILFLLKKDRAFSMFSSLGEVSFGVFFCHMIILPLVNKIFSLVLNSSLIMNIIVGLITLIVSFICCLVIKRIVGVYSKKYFGF